MSGPVESNFKRKELSQIQAVRRINETRELVNQKLLSSVKVCRNVQIFFATLVFLAAGGTGGYLMVSHLKNMRDIYFLAGAIVTVAGVTAAVALIRNAIMSAREQVERQKRNMRAFGNENIRMRDIVGQVENLNEISDKHMAAFVHAFIESAKSGKEIEKRAKMARAMMLSPRVAERDKDLMMHNLGGKPEFLNQMLPEKMSDENVSVFRRAMRWHASVFRQITVANYLGDSALLQMYIDRAGNIDEQLLREQGEVILIGLNKEIINGRLSTSQKTLVKALGKRPDLLKAHLDKVQLSPQLRLHLARSLSGNENDRLECLNGLRDEDIFKKDRVTQVDETIAGMFIRLAKRVHPEDYFDPICAILERNPRAATLENIQFLSQTGALADVLAKVDEEVFMRMALVMNRENDFMSRMRDDELQALAEGINRHRMVLGQQVHPRLLQILVKEETLLPGDPNSDIDLVKMMIQKEPDMFFAQQFNKNPKYRTPQMMQIVSEMGILGKILQKNELTPEAFGEIADAVASNEVVRKAMVDNIASVKRDHILALSIPRKIALLKVLPNTIDGRLIADLLPANYPDRGDVFDQLVAAGKFDIVMNNNNILKEAIEHFNSKAQFGEKIEAARRAALLKMGPNISADNRLRIALAQGEATERGLIPTITDKTTLIEVLRLYVQRDIKPSKPVFDIIGKVEGFGAVVNDLYRQTLERTTADTRFKFAKAMFPYMGASDQAKYMQFAQ